MTLLKRFWRWLTDADATEHDIAIIKLYRQLEKEEHERRMVAHQKRKAAREIYMID